MHKVLGTFALISIFMMPIAADANGGTTGSRWPPLSIAGTFLGDGELELSLAADAGGGHHVSLSVGQTVGDVTDPGAGPPPLALRLGSALEHAMAARPATATGGLTREAEIEYVSIGYLRFVKLKPDFDRVLLALGAEFGAYDVGDRDDDFGANLRAAFSFEGPSYERFIMSFEVGLRYHYVGLSGDDLDFAELTAGIRFFFGRRHQAPAPPPPPVP